MPGCDVPLTPLLLPAQEQEARSMGAHYFHTWGDATSGQGLQVRVSSLAAIE